MTITTKLWDPAERLRTVRDRAGYIRAAREERDLQLLRHVFKDVERAKRMWGPGGVRLRNDAAAQAIEAAGVLGTPPSRHGRAGTG